MFFRTLVFIVLFLFQFFFFKFFSIRIYLKYLLRSYNHYLLKKFYSHFYSWFWTPWPTCLDKKTKFKKFNNCKGKEKILLIHRVYDYSTGYFKKSWGLFWRLFFCCCFVFWEGFLFHFLFGEVDLCPGSFTCWLLTLLLSYT